MKNKILLAASLIISASTFAQVQPSFGVRAGVTSSGMRGDAVNNLQSMIDYTNGMVSTSNHTGYFGGGYVAIPVSDMLSIEPAVYYTQKGYEVKGELNIKGIGFLGANAKGKLQSNYIDVPVMVKANINGLQLFAGPQLSYLTKADFRTTAGALGINFYDKKMDATDQFNRWDAALSGGIGYQFANGLNISAAYDHGLSKVDANQNMNSYNHSIKVGLGMIF